MDVTDLGSREGNDTATRRSQRSGRRSSAHSGRQGAERDRQGGRTGAQSEHEPPSTPIGRQTPRSTSKRASSSTPETSSSTSERRAARAPRKSRSTGASRRKDATRQKSVSSKATSANASTPRTSKPSGGESKPARRVSSGESAKTGSPVSAKLPRALGLVARPQQRIRPRSPAGRVGQARLVGEAAKGPSQGAGARHTTTTALCATVRHLTRPSAPSLWTLASRCWAVRSESLGGSFSSEACFNADGSGA